MIMKPEKIIGAYEESKTRKDKGSQKYIKARCQMRKIPKAQNI